MRQRSFLEHAKAEFKQELRVWHLLLGGLLVGMVAGFVVTHGKSGLLQLCQHQAEEAAKQQIVRKLETSTAIAPNELAAQIEQGQYDRAYSRCLAEIGLK